MYFLITKISRARPENEEGCLLDDETMNLISKYRYITITSSTFEESYKHLVWKINIPDSHALKALEDMCIEKRHRYQIVDQEFLIQPPGHRVVINGYEYMKEVIDSEGNIEYQFSPTTF